MTGPDFEWHHDSDQLSLRLSFLKRHGQHCVLWQLQASLSPPQAPCPQFSTCFVVCILPSVCLFANTLQKTTCIQRKIDRRDKGHAYCVKGLHPLNSLSLHLVILPAVRHFYPSSICLPACSTIRIRGPGIWSHLAFLMPNFTVILLSAFLTMENYLAGLSVLRKT